MKNKVTIGMLLASAMAFGQEVELPKVVLPSPEAYEITKYGDIPADERTGMVNTSIPIYTYRAGKLEVPISLNYAGAGVKVDQLATWTGINWTLAAGGAITRTINGAADEGSEISRLEVETIFAMDLRDGTDDTANLHSLLTNTRPLWDFNPDLFSFSFPGYSGSFFLDKDYIPRLSKAESNLKIEILGSEADLRARLRNEKRFCITTPEGIKYFFGGTGATEFSYTTSDPHAAHLFYPTSFYLSSIQHPDHGTIYFDYLEAGGANLSLGRTQSINIITSIVIPNAPYCSGATPSTVRQTSATFSRFENGLFLSKIRSDNNTVEVSFSSSFGSASNYRRILNGIAVKDGSNELSKIDFSYLFPNLAGNSQRFFLTKLEFNRDHSDAAPGKKNEQYVMEYNDPMGLPDRLSYAVDLAGYYNGKIGNTTLLPKYVDPLFDASIPNLADRRGDFSFAAKGSLSKIYYPTKGHTAFEYEPIQSKEYDRAGNYLTIWRNESTRIPASKKTASYGFVTFVNNGEMIESVGSLMDQQVKVYVNVVAAGQMGHTDTIKLKMIDNTNNTEVVVQLAMPLAAPSEGLPVDYTADREYTFNFLKDHVYTLEVSSSYAFSTVPFTATVSFSHIKGYKIAENGGIRIKRITDFTNEGHKAGTKRYYYHEATDLSKNILDILELKSDYNFVENGYMNQCCSVYADLAFFEAKEYFYRTLSSAYPFPELFDRKYEYVTVSYGGDDFEAGGTEKRFDNRGLATSIGIFPSGSQGSEGYSKGNLEGIYHGTLLKETQLAKRNGLLCKTREEAFTYRYLPTGYMDGVTGHIQGQACARQLISSSNVNVGMYSFLSKRAELLSSTAVEFTIPMPLGATGETSYNPIRTVRSMEYGELIGLPVKVTSSISGEGRITETRNTYVHEASQLAGLTSQQAEAYQKLAGRNQVSAPAETRVYRSDPSSLALVSTQRMLFREWSGSPNLILPHIAQYSKGDGALEDRIAFEGYDSRANAVLVSLKDGPRTRYAYNNLGKLTLKIENYIVPPSAGNGPFDQLPALDAIPDTASPCALSQLYPKSSVTRFYYNSRYLMVKSTDTNCTSTFFEYDGMDRLKRIRNEQQEILKEFDYSYKNQ
ncbi:hypothetical protein ACFPVY_07210 [Flavobacterium qiangtangense]|uniref:YD repeat-containing protein n=1 Tax=Flavobacterium qiangtangense TaxID=1442595 RepID=A0ABW1PN54_9FLAO